MFCSTVSKHALWMFGHGSVVPCPNIHSAQVFVMVFQTLLSYYNTHLFLASDVYLKENCTRNQNRACFVCNFKLINVFWKASYSKWSKKLKYDIKVSVSQAVLSYCSNILHVWSITQAPLGLLKFQCHFWVA